MVPESCRLEQGRYFLQKRHRVAEVVWDVHGSLTASQESNTHELNLEAILIKTILSLGSYGALRLPIVFIKISSSYTVFLEL